MRSVIIGGGVAGCAVAAALRGSNVASESVILERRLPGAPNGMGFILMPNGIQALESIAPEFDWRSAGQTIDRVSLRSRSGAIFAETPIESAVCVSRERFLEMLRAAANQTQFIDGASMAGLDQHADESTRAVRLQDGSVIEGDVFFACDGARSRTREILFPEAKLSDVAVQEIVSVADAPALACALGTTFRKFHDEEGGLAVGMLAESATRVVWFMQFDAARWTNVASNPESMQRFMFERIKGWAPEVLEAFHHTDFSMSHLWPTRDLPPMAALAHRNLALVGDAAHACLPFTSQGANGALVDAALLAKLLAESQSAQDINAAFTRYSAIRRPHHQRMFDEGRRLRAQFLAPIGRSAPCIPLVA